MFSALLKRLSEFTPKTYICIKEGYSLDRFFHDLLAGITIGIISLPLTMAFSIASGLPPERGLFTGIVAGFLISLLGGSRVQIGGPTGAFVVIIYSVVERHGYEGLALATLLAGGMMILLALVRAGVLLKFIPYSVTTGFTAGIALSILSSQVKDLFGLPIAQVPADFIDKWTLYLHHMSEWNPWALFVSLSCLGIIFFFRAYFPRIPGAVIAVAFAGSIVYFGGIPVETIQSKFGQIPSMLPNPSLPFFSLDKIQAIFPDAITIALLGSIESLLSAVVADGMTGHRHRSNTELFAQGLANMASVLFGGIPATGAIARTAANIKMGATTPIAGMTHAITLLILILYFAPFAAQIPLPALAAVLVFVAWNMSEIGHIATICKGPKQDIVVLAITFLLTILIDITVAVQVGVILAAILFLKNMSDVTALKATQLLIEQDTPLNQNDSELIFRKDVPDEVAVFEVDGPLFFGMAGSLQEPLRQISPSPKIFILRMKRVPLIDASGLHALSELAKTCKQKQIHFFISGVKAEHFKLFNQTGLTQLIGTQALFGNFNDALAAARKKLPASAVTVQPAV